MKIHTRNIAVRECIRIHSKEFEDDIDNKFFMTADRATDGFEDDHMDGVAQQVFLEFILGNIDEDIQIVRGVYWHFKIEKENDQYHQINDCGSYIRGLTSEQKEQFKKDILNRIAYDRAISADNDLMDKVEDWGRIEKGWGKLQDNKKHNKQLISILDLMTKHAEKHLQPNDKKITMPEFKDEGEEILYQYDRNYEQLRKSIKQYQSMRAYRENHPVDAVDETMLEFEFRNRFGVDMFTFEK